MEHLGQIGDSFNILTSLFAGLAFAAVIITIRVQQQELKEAREEFRGQKEALENQQKEMINQSFDNKFFQILNLFNSNANSLWYYTMDSKDKNIKKHGKEIFTSIFFDLEIDIMHNINNYDDFIKKFNGLYYKIVKSYFIQLYQILKHVDQEINDIEKAKIYIDIIKSQLIKSELIILFYAIAIDDLSDGNYKKLIEKYSFFEYLQYEDFTNMQKFIDIVANKYNLTAFGKNSFFINATRLKR